MDYLRPLLVMENNKFLATKSLEQLQAEIDACNKESGLNIQLITNEPTAFDGMMAHYGKISGVQNYIALIGKKGADLEEMVGYYGERIVLKAQMLGLNTCWVALTFSKGSTKKNCRIMKNEKIACFISIGFGNSQGVAHKSKEISIRIRRRQGNSKKYGRILF